MEDMNWEYTESFFKELTFEVSFERVLINKMFIPFLKRDRVRPFQIA